MRLTFSIVDVRGEHDEGLDNESASEEGEEDAAQEEEVLTTYPIRASLSITKVCVFQAVSTAVVLMCLLL